LVGFYRHSKSPHSSSFLLSHLISSYVNIFCDSFYFVRKSVERRVLWEVLPLMCVAVSRCSVLWRVLLWAVVLSLVNWESYRESRLTVYFVVALSRWTRTVHFPFFIIVVNFYLFCNLFILWKKLSYAFHSRSISLSYTRLCSYTHIDQNHNSMTTTAQAWLVRNHKYREMLWSWDVQLIRLPICIFFSINGSVA